MERWQQSGAKNPCPICGRTKDADCRIRQDGQMVFCHRGKSLGPPERLKVGDTLTDSLDRLWAYTGDSRDDSRDGAVFVIHQDKPGTSLPACEPWPTAVPLPAVKNELPCLATTYQYREDLRVVRSDYEGDKKKDFQPQFFFNGRWNAGAGSEIWPFYGSVDNNSGASIIEVEGEKCVDVLRAQGIAAITHPGHQRDEVKCRARYAGLLSVGVKTVYFISDNDTSGRKKAAAFLAAAQLAQIELRVIPAESICNVPDGGSVDDMPAEQLGSLIAVAIKSASGAKPAPLNRVSYGAIKKALQEFYETNPASAADIQAGVADIASAHDASAFDTRRIWDSLEEDRQVEDEALGATTAITQRQSIAVKRESVAIADYLPDSILDAVETLTANLACDPLTATAVVLTTAAGAFKAGHRVDAGDGLFVKEPIMWLLLSGSSGSGKSPIMRHLCQNRLRLVLNHYDHISETAESEYEARYLNVAKALRPDRPEPLQTCIANFTTESLTGILGDNHRQGLGTFIYSEEIKEILGNFDEYKTGGKGKGKETFLCLFDGNVNTSHRVGKRAKMVKGKVQNSLLGGVQPGVFRKMIEEGDDAGLFARCLMVPLVNDYKEPNFCRSPEELIAVHMAEQCLDNFYLRCLELKPIVLRLEPEAVELFKALHRDTYDKSQAVSLESQRAVYGKRLGYVLQVALVMHLCRVASNEETASELYLSKQLLARATVLVDLLQSYAIVEQQESQMQRHGAFDLNRRVHVYAKTNNGCTAAKFVSVCVPVRHRRTVQQSQVKAAMEQLVSMGLGEWREGKSQSFVALGRFPD
jgi:CRISPR-associated protein Cmr3